MRIRGLFLQGALLVALMLPGFRIAGFWTAVGGALIVSIVSWIGSWFIGSRGRVEVIRKG